MSDTLRWAYALNQWNFRMDVFVRHEHQQRALKTVSAVGFDHIELASGTGGRWDNIGRPEVILANHGDAAGFLRFLAQADVHGVSSHFWDPGLPAEEEGYAFLMPLDPGQHDRIVAAAEPFIGFLAAVGGERLVVRPAPSAWMTGPLDDDAIRLLGTLWNRVGARAREAGVGLALHYDCLGGIHSRAQLETLLDATDPALVGLALDTAEFTIGGIDPVTFYRAHADRITHVHLKDVRDVDAGGEYLMPGAEQAMLQGGGGRHIERWVYELGTDGGLVDLKQFVAALREQKYPGWVVVESDHAGEPAEMAMLNSWYATHELDKTQ